MTTLRVIVDEFVAQPGGEVSAYTAALVRALIATAPTGASVAGYVSASPEPDYELIAETFPGLDGLGKSALARRELRAAWRRGVVGLPGGGIVHAPSLLAPLYRHDRLHNPGEQIVVTLHDTLAWTRPESLPSSTVAWTKAMAKRAERFADAVVAPSHPVAESAREVLDLGERVRVIPPASLLWPTRAEPLEPEFDEPFVLAAVRPGAVDEYERLAEELGSIGRGGILQLIVPGGAHAPNVGSHVRVWSSPSPERQRALFTGAAAYIDPVAAEGGAAWLLEALASGTPALHHDVPDLVELAFGASVVIPDRPGAVVDALEAVLSRPEDRDRLAVAGRDRARAFTWRDAAEGVWQLHAEL